jgi:hypothetical protein
MSKTSGRKLHHQVDREGHKQAEMDTIRFTEMQLAGDKRDAENEQLCKVCDELVSEMEKEMHVLEKLNSTALANYSTLPHVIKAKGKE